MIDQNRVALSVREVATACGYSAEAVRRAIQDGKLTATRPGGRGDYRILVSDMHAWLRGDGQVRVDRPSPFRRDKRGDSLPVE
jgi:excisionase family DNA binding protein